MTQYAYPSQRLLHEGEATCGLRKKKSARVMPKATEMEAQLSSAAMVYHWPQFVTDSPCVLVGMGAAVMTAPSGMVTVPRAGLGFRQGQHLRRKGKTMVKAGGQRT